MFLFLCIPGKGFTSLVPKLCKLFSLLDQPCKHCHYQKEVYFYNDKRSRDMCACRNLRLHPNHLRIIYTQAPCYPDEKTKH